MTKATRARYTLEFKQEAVRLAEGGQSIAAAARSLGVVEQTLFTWVKDGNIYTSAGTSASIDLALAWVEEDCGAGLAHDAARELVRVKMERDILGKATAACGVC